MVLARMMAGEAERKKRMTRGRQRRKTVGRAMRTPKLNGLPK